VNRQALLDLLSSHLAADADEADSLARIRALIADGEDPWSRGIYAPGHLTASAVVVDAERRRALLIHHAKLQLWLQPGGHFEPDERDPRGAAAREVLEETGLRTQPAEGGPAILDVDVHRIPARKDEPAHEHFDLRLLLVAQEGEAFAGDGAEAIRWITPAEVDAMDLDPGLRRALAKVPWAT
jgi:8-oxo-dGTP pyrophosphatase MutT (NUDIX family)